MTSTTATAWAVVSAVQTRNRGWAKAVGKKNDNNTYNAKDHQARPKLNQDRDSNSDDADFWMNG